MSSKRVRRHLYKTPRLYYTPWDSHQAGALVYTNRLYAKLDPDRAMPKWRRWLTLRDKWITEQERVYGKDNLTCSICGKTGLKGFTKNRNEMATIDHIKPVSSFPHLWDVPSNFQLACYRCIQKKGCSCWLSLKLCYTVITIKNKGQAEVTRPVWGTGGCVRSFNG
jgi:5-methylcytosine-specific restriction endonuclease McrA